MSLETSFQKTGQIVSEATILNNRAFAVQWKIQLLPPAQPLAFALRHCQNLKTLLVAKEET